MIYKTTKDHYYGLDLIRLIFIWAIVNFHVYETFFYQTENILPTNYSIYSNLETLIKTFTFSGFGLITLSSFLMGLINMNFKKWKQLFIVFTVGCLLLALLNAENHQWFYFEWDVYNFLFVCFLLISILQLNHKLLYFTSILVFCLLFFPIWNLDFYLNNLPTLKNILLGDCNKPGLGGWPLLPWAGMVFASYSIGKYIQYNNELKSKLQIFTKIEFIIWFILIFSLSPWLGTYSLTPMGPDFACFTHRRPPIEFFSHWILLLFFIRISLVNSVNIFLKKQKWVLFISNLQWNKNLGLAYALQFIFLNIGYNWHDLYLNTPFLIDFFILFLFLGVEFTCRTTTYLFGHEFLKKQI